MPKNKKQKLKIQRTDAQQEHFDLLKDGGSEKTYHVTAETAKLQKVAVQMWRNDEASAMELGAALSNVREAMQAQGHGAFTMWFRAQGMKANRVNYCIRLVEGKVKAAAKKKAAKAAKALTVRLEFGDSSLRTSLNLLAESRGKNGVPVAEVVAEIVADWISTHKADVDAAKQILSVRGKTKQTERRYAELEMSISASEARLKSDKEKLQNIRTALAAESQQAYAAAAAGK
jgi:hypothetical protein